MRYKTLGRHAVFQVSGWDVVEPGLERVAAAFDAHLVPIVLAKGLAGRLVVRQIVEPAAPPFIVNSAGPGAIRGIDLGLVAVNATGGNFYCLAFVRNFRRLVKRLAAELHAGVERGVDFELELQDEIAEIAIGAQKRVTGVGNAGADDLAILGAVLCRPAALLPAGQRLAVEKRAPIFVLGQR